jgi:hypothetical protein
MFAQFQPDHIVDEQADIPVKFYKCTDGVMRAAYEHREFEERVEWRGFGFRVRKPH